MTTSTIEAREPAYRVNRNAEGLTEKEQQFLELWALGTMTQSAIAETMGVNKQRISEIKKNLEAKGKLRPPKELDLFSKSEWRAVSNALRKFAADPSGTQPAKDAAVRAIEKSRQLVPKGVSW